MLYNKYIYEFNIILKQLDPDLQKLWDLVNKNRNDFLSWTYLLQHVEQGVSISIPDVIRTFVKVRNIYISTYHMYIFANYEYEYFTKIHAIDLLVLIALIIYKSINFVVLLLI